ncbi:hypothetical protein H6G54_17070 [Anabaena cylindrica FACHB-243]|uniref:Uncharacterized protein n=1 Tax=Anabaena cylindrica (strain ATCC 27899 / PCC 7122) TaxID=272123 RepID=K9ZG53_ANACC|nr:MULTISPECIES: hypothetical protein [Anabaena]AFZ57709.1 hypothetical protein Anacy_2251 [Anabaena cylindrica PCC 7122]MBD2419378.1 hypothetical protein [Anabaena cylindrica FACHB-243]MBY5280618.1 hypothetical protein [Anabaena sp. CCAP 1446/1C]MBY5307842.1 hypothetical protein [Anabaena sp. CCAP 1446/1C]MCM2409197.1 hypothetical protein [Anabaena sp. CCAP 1446/1C]
MTTTITPNLTTFLEDLKSADLVGISLNPHNLGLRLDFTFGPEADDVAIELYQIIHFVFSQSLNPDDEDICFWVGEVELKKIEDDIHGFLSKLGLTHNSRKKKPFKEIVRNIFRKSLKSNPFIDQNEPVNTNLQSLIYFHLQGDISLEVVCKDYKIFQQIKN